MNLIKTIKSTVGSRINSLRESGDAGASAVEFILITLGVIVIAAAVVAAITAYINGQIGQLPG